MISIFAEVTHADGCDGQCARWIAANAPGCLPYPCKCAETRDNAPEWARKQGQARCYWQKKGQEDTPGGGYRSRCPCWGDNRDGKPGDCCAHHSASPRYATPTTVATADPEAPAPDVEPLDVDTPPPLDGEPDEGLDWGGDPDAVERKPHVRRWLPAELTCTCILPFQDDKKTAKVHCVDCHNDFANPQTFSVHRRNWTRPCRDPYQIRDCVTGRPLLYCDGEGTWRDSYPSADDGVAEAAPLIAA